MHIDIDQYSEIDSIIHNWDIRIKIATFFLIILFLSVQKNFVAGLSGVVFAVFISILSRIPFYFLVKRVVFPILFLVPLFLFLPLSSGGEVLLNLGYINVYLDGVKIAGIIFLKTGSLILIFLIMLGSANFFRTISALKKLKIPEIILSIILFTYRYIYTYLEDVRKMKIALTLRGFKNKNSISSLKSSANLAGSILIRSYEQTERINNAMIVRGFTGNLFFYDEFHLEYKDFIKSIFFIMIFLIIYYSLLFLEGLF